MAQPIEQKLQFHLVRIVLLKTPGVPYDGQQILELCQQATLEDRQQAYLLSLQHSPAILDNEVGAAMTWVQGCCPGCGFTLLDHGKWGCPSPGEDEKEILCEC